MGQTKKRNYERYTLAFKQQAVKLANHPNVNSKDIAEGLGLHPVMLYRWQLEYRRGELVENEILFHLLNIRREYTALAKMATKVSHTLLLGHSFTTYYFSVGQQKV